MAVVRLEYAGEEAVGQGADTDEALSVALRRLSVARGRNEWFIATGKRKDEPEGDHAIKMSYRTDITSELNNIYALDLGRHYRGAIETVRVIANLEFGFAGRTRHAIEEVAIYAIGAAKYLMRVSGQSIDVREDILKSLQGTRWRKLIDVENLLLKRSG